MKQQNLKEHRDYLNNPRRSNEFDPDFRGDINYFEESRTKQADAQSADINYILSKYTMEEVQSWRQGEDLFLDLSTVETYREAMDVVANANSAFYEMPASIRAHFQNDPSRMLELVEKAQKGSTESAQILVDLGLANKRGPAPESPTEILAAIRENTRREPASAESDAPKTRQDGVKTTKKG